LGDLHGDEDNQNNPLTSYHALENNKNNLELPPPCSSLPSQLSLLSPQHKKWREEKIKKFFPTVQRNENLPVQGKQNKNNRLSRWVIRCCWKNPPHTENSEVTKDLINEWLEYHRILGNEVKDFIFQKKDLITDFHLWISLVDRPKTDYGFPDIVKKLGSETIVGYRSWKEFGRGYKTTINFPNLVQDQSYVYVSRIGEINLLEEGEHQQNRLAATEQDLSLSKNSIPPDSSTSQNKEEEKKTKEKSRYSKNKETLFAKNIPLDSSNILVCHKKPRHHSQKKENNSANQDSSTTTTKTKTTTVAAPPSENNQNLLIAILAYQTQLLQNIFQQQRTQMRINYPPQMNQTKWNFQPIQLDNIKNLEFNEATDFQKFPFMDENTEKFRSIEFQEEGHNNMREGIINNELEYHQQQIAIDDTNSREENEEVIEPKVKKYHLSRS